MKVLLLRNSVRITFNTRTSTGDGRVGSDGPDAMRIEIAHLVPCDYISLISHMLHNISFLKEKCADIEFFSSRLIGFPWCTLISPCTKMILMGRS